MLDAFIIEEIKRREQEAERRRERERPRQELPVPTRPDADKDGENDDTSIPDRGVTIIDYTVDNTCVVCVL